MKKEIIPSFKERAAQRTEEPVFSDSDFDKIPMDPETEAFFRKDFIEDLRRKKESGSPMIYTCACGDCIGQLTASDLYGQALAGTAHGERLTNDYLYFIKMHAHGLGLTPKELAARQKEEARTIKIRGNPSGPEELL